MNGIPHGFGAGVGYANLTAQWREIGVFAESVLSAE